jgi:hypothetical protein
MNSAPSTVAMDRPPLSFTQRVVVVASWAVGVALFLTLGRLTMQPDDPLGAVSVLARHNALLMLIQGAALAGVTAGIATVMAGRRLPDVGTFSAALGMIVVSVRGGTAEYFLLQGAETSASFERGLAWGFAAESIGWFVVMVVSAGVSGLVLRWCFGRVDDADASQSKRSGATGLLAAGLDVPGVSTRFLGVSGDDQTDTGSGVRHTLIATAVGLVAFVALSAGLSARSIQHGQVCFVVAAAVCIATYVAYRMVPVRSALWSILAVGLVTSMGYVWAALAPTTAGLPPSIPSSHFLRILPIQFISVGVAAVVGTSWYIHAPAVDEVQGG